MTVEEAIKKLQELPPKATLYEYDAEWDHFSVIRSFDLGRFTYVDSNGGKRMMLADPAWSEKRLNGKKVFDAVVVNY